MKNKALLGIILGLLISATSYSCDPDGKTGIVEDNGLWISEDQKTLTGISSSTKLLVASLRKVDEIISLASHGSLLVRMNYYFQILPCT